MRGYFLGFTLIALGLFGVVHGVLYKPIIFLDGPTKDVIKRKSSVPRIRIRNIGSGIVFIVLGILTAVPQSGNVNYFGASGPWVLPILTIALILSTNSELNGLDFQGPQKGRSRFVFIRSLLLIAIWIIWLISVLNHPSYKPSIWVIVALTMYAIGIFALILTRKKI